MGNCEQQYAPIHDLAVEHTERLGMMSGHTWHEDPKRLLFTLARYKWVAKMLQGHRRVLEIGCGDGWASRVVRQHVEQLTCVDLDERFVANARANASEKWPIGYAAHDFAVDDPLSVLSQWPGYNRSVFTAAYCLDVLEHVPPDVEGDFMRHAFNALVPDGVFIVGMPSLESQPHASKLSREGHVNCKTQVGLRELMQRWYRNVFTFGMNDEVVHTGFAPMCHYLLAMGVGKR